MIAHLDAHMRQGLDRTLGYIDLAGRNGATGDAAPSRETKRPGRIES
jgi:hypothetical protein